MIDGIVLGVIGTVAAFALIFAAVKLSRKESISIEDLQRKSARLRDALSELMARADDADQESKYLGEKLNTEVSEKLSRICSDLVLLGDAVRVIESRLQSNEIGHAKKDLLISLGAAKKINREIHEVREEIRRKRLPG
jgi:hypothetical protein